MFKQFKIAILGLCLGSIVTMGLFAEDDIFWGSNYMPGNLVGGAAAAYETSRIGSGQVLSLYPSAEMILWKPNFAGYAPFDFGVAADGRFALPLNSYSKLTAGVGLEGSLHFGFKGFDFPYSEYLDRVDLYARFGLSFDLIKPTGADAFGTVATSGVNYFLDDRLLVGLSYTGWGSYDSGYDGVSLQVRYRLGKNSTVKGMGDSWRAYEEAVDDLRVMGPLTQFYAFFYFAIYSGGYYWASDTYEEGEGTVWRYTDDDEDVFFMERTLLERSAAGDEWWSLRYFDEDGEEYEFEFLLTAEQELVTLYYEDENGMAKKYDFTGDEEMHTYLEQGTTVDSQDLESMASDKETVTVPAGTFKDCMTISQIVEDAEYWWWFTDGKKVPGQLVKFVTVDSGDQLTGELENLIDGRKGDFRLK